MKRNQAEIPVHMPYVKIVFGVMLAMHLLLGYFLPLQDDEIGWIVNNDRAVTDGFSYVTLVPQCKTYSAYSQALPIGLLYPHAIINHLLIGISDNVSWYRILGMMRYLLILGALYCLAIPVGRILGMLPSVVFLAGVSFLWLDAMPLLLQITRPEQSLLLGVLILMAMAFNSDRLRTMPWSRYAAVPVMLLVTFCVFPAHPKAIALLPIAIWCAYRITASLWGRKWAYLSVFIVVLVAWQSIAYILIRVDCPESDYIQRFIQDHSLQYGLLFTSPALFVKEVALVFSAFILKDLSPTYFSEWMPSALHELPEFAEYAIIAIILLMVLLRIAIFFSCIRLFAKGLKHMITGRTFAGMHSQTGWGALALLMFATCMLVVMLPGKGRMFYLPTLELPLLFISWILLICAYGENRHSHYFTTGKWIKPVLILVLASNIALFYRYYPLIMNTKEAELTLKYDNYERPIMYNIKSTMLEKEKVEEVYRECGLPPVTEARHLVLDMGIYPYFKDSFQPYIFSYFSDSFLSNHYLPAADFMRRLEQFHAGGLLVQCKNMPPDYRSLFEQHQGYCCKAFP